MDTRLVDTPATSAKSALNAAPTAMPPEDAASPAMTSGEHGNPSARDESTTVASDNSDGRGDADGVAPVEARGGADTETGDAKALGVVDGDAPRERDAVDERVLDGVLARNGVSEPLLVLLGVAEGEAPVESVAVGVDVIEGDAP